MFTSLISFERLDEEQREGREERGEREEDCLIKKNHKNRKKYKVDESKPLLDEDEDEEEDEEEERESEDKRRRDDKEENGQRLEGEYLLNPEDSRGSGGMKQVSREEIIQIVEEENYSLENYGNDLKSEESHENGMQSSDVLIMESDQSPTVSKPTDGPKSTNPFQDTDDSNVLLNKSGTENKEQLNGSEYKPQDTESLSNVPPLKPPKPKQKSTNPFADDDESSPLPAALQKSKSSNPFDDTSPSPAATSTSSTNPFSPDYTPPPTTTGLKTTKPSYQMKKSQSAKSQSTNPFDADYPAPPSAPPRRRSPNLFRSPSSPSSIGTPPQSPGSASSRSHFSENSPEYLDLITLLQLGFLASQAYHSLQTHKDLESTLQSLRVDLLSALSSKTSPNWYPPVLTRIGSWMPSQANSSSRVLYYIKVQLNHSDIAYVITKRFSEFVNFHYRVSPYFQRNCNILPSSSSSKILYPSDVMAPFVDDRIGGYLWGTSEELCNRRQDMLHKWLSHLCLSERMMTDLTIHKMVMEFFQIDQFIQRTPVLTGVPERPLTLQ